MNRVGLATISSVVAAAIALAVVWVITLVRDTSLSNAIQQPTFWLVEGLTIALTAAAILTQTNEQPPTTRPPRSPITQILTATAWTAAAALLIGTLLAVATDTPTANLLTSLKFLIPAGIAITIAALEAWPDEPTTDDPS